MKLEYTSLNKIRQNPKLYARLQSLTLAGSSHMRDILRKHVQAEKKVAHRYDTRNVRILVARKQNSVVGWCLSFGGVYGNSMTYFFVKPDMRRRGIGSALFRKRKEDLRKRKKRMQTVGWDSRSEAFFEAMK